MISIFNQKKSYISHISYELNIIVGNLRKGEK